MVNKKNCEGCDPCEDQTIKSGAHTFPDCTEPNPCSAYTHSDCVLTPSGGNVTAALANFGTVTAATDSAEVELMLLQIPLPLNSAGRISITIVGRRGAQTILSTTSFLYNTGVANTYITPGITLNIDYDLPIDGLSDITPTDFYATPTATSFTIFILPDSAVETIWTASYTKVIASE